MKPLRWTARRGFSLIEMLCVMVIIAILMAMLMPAIMRAFQKAKGMAEEVESSGVFELLLKSTRSYCASTTNYQFSAKTDFTDK